MSGTRPVVCFDHLHIPADLKAMVRRTMAQPRLTSDALLILADHAREAASSTDYPLYSGAWSQISDFYAHKAPLFADVPLVRERAA